MKQGFGGRVYIIDIHCNWQYLIIVMFEFESWMLYVYTYKEKMKIAWEVEKWHNISAYRLDVLFIHVNYELLHFALC